MKKIYIGELLPNIPPTEILYSQLGNGEAENPFGEKIFSHFIEPVVEIVKAPESADFFCLPHNYNYVKKNAGYLMQFSALAEKYGKKIIIFFPGDSDEDVPIKNSIIFRNSQYKYKKKDNEIIMPAYAVDLGAKYGFSFRNRGEKPVIGFCGWASYRSLREWASYYFANFSERIFGVSAQRKGLYFRRKALAILSKSKLVVTNFIIRTSYSGSNKTINLDTKKARDEYVSNMKNSDLTLAPKGDGNFSVRFFESLSLARIPLLIDTDCPLPLEGEISYDDFILRVDHTKLSTLPTQIAHFFSFLSNENYLLRQKKCREVFEKYLKIDMFFKYVFTGTLLDKYK